MPGLLEKPVQLVVPVAHPEPAAEPTEPLGRQPVAVGQQDLLRRQVVGDPAHQCHVVGVAGVELGVLAGHAWVRTRVDVVGRGGEPGKAADHVARVETLGRQGEVRHRDPPAVALGERLPAPAPGDALAQHLRVAHDAVGTHQPEVRRDVGVRPTLHGEPGERRAPPGPALVEQEHPVRLGRVLQPSVLHPGPRGLAARPALEEQQPRQVVVLAVDGDHLAREHLDRAVVVLRRMVERHLHHVVGEHVAGNPRRHDPILAQP